jgi:hypothetical protein
MDRKDWLVPLLAAVIGVMGTLAGSLVAGYQHERAAARQAHLTLLNNLPLNAPPNSKHSKKPDCTT